MVEMALKHVYKKYDNAENYSVTDFNLSIDDREFIVFVGPSGCGKSTTLRMIAGLEDISEGELNIGGKVMNDVAPKDRDIAMVFQNYALYPHMTVLENICFPLEIKRVPKKQRIARAMELADLVRIGDFLKRKPGELSGGQQQRVAIARALAKEPALLLLDEPLSNLDAKLRVEMREEILRIQRASRVTTVFVTHDQEEASSISDTVVLLKLGVLQQLGTARQLYDQPSNYFVADFLGAPPINKLRGTLEQGCFRFENTSLTCPVAPVKNVPDGTPVILALRAESVLVPAAGESRLMTTVKERYSIGKDELSVLEAGGQQLRAFIPGDYPLEPGQQLEIGFKKRGFFLFDAQTGERLQ